MAAGDLALKMLIVADSSGAVAAVGLVGTHLLGLSSLFPNLKNGLGNIAFGLRNLGTAGTIGMDALKQGAVQAGNAFFKLGLTLASIGVVAALAFGAIAIHAAADYQAALTRLYTTAGETHSNLKMVGDGMLAMSVQVGTGAQTLAQAMYFVESAGFHGQKGLDVLKVAAMGAKAENSDLTSVVKTLVSTLNAYTGTGLTAAGAMNTLIAATSQGHMTLNDLAGAVSNVLPATARFHISLIDTTAAIAEMTKQGDNASSAATHLRQMILSLEAPSKIGAASMKEVGLSSQALSDEMKKSLPGAIQMVTDAVGRKFPEGSAAYNQAIKNIAGGSRQMMGFLELSGKHTKDFAEIVKTMSGDVKQGGSSIMGWSAIQGNFNFKMDQAKAAVEALFIKIGTALLPVITNLVSNITPLIVGFTTWLTTGGRLQAIIGFISTAFSFLGTAIAKIIQIGVGIVNFFRNNEVAMDALKATLILAAIVIGVVLVAAFVAAAIAVWGFTIALLANPITWIVIAIIAVITGIILVITHWGQIMTWIGNVMSAVGTFIHGVLSAIGAWFGSVFSAIGTTVHNALSGIGQKFSEMGAAVHAKLTDIKNFIGGIFSAIGTKIHDALTGVATFFINKWNDLVSFVKSIPGKIGQALGNLKDILLAPFKWLYDHNWYVKAAVDAIKQDITNVKNFVGGAFDWLGTHIHDALTGIKNGVGGAFDWLGTHAHDFATGVKNTVGGAFDWLGTHVHEAMTGMKNTTGNAFDGIGSHARTFATGTKNTVGSAFDWIGSHTHSVMSAMGDFIGSKMSDIGSTFRNALTNIKNTFGNIFDQIGTAVHSKLTGLWNWITGFVSGWPAQAFQWGASLIQGLINGIGSMFSALGGAVSHIAGIIGNFLGFHAGSLIPPKQGPAKDADTWIPALMHGLIGGIQEGTPHMHAALSNLMQPLTAGKSSFALSGANGAFALPSSSTTTSGGYGMMNLHIKLDSREIAEAVGIRMAKEVRINGARNR